MGELQDTDRLMESLRVEHVKELAKIRCEHRALHEKTPENEIGNDSASEMRAQKASYASGDASWVQFCAGGDSLPHQPSEGSDALRRSQDFTPSKRFTLPSTISVRTHFPKSDVLRI